MFQIEEILCINVAHAKVDRKIISCYGELKRVCVASGEATKSLHLEGGTKDSQGIPCLLQQSSGNGNFS